LAKVKVKFYANFRRKYGVKEVEVDCDGGLKSLVEALNEKVKGVKEDIFDEKEGDVKGDVLFLINGVNVKTMDKAKISFSDGDQVAIFPPIAGG